MTVQESLFSDLGPDTPVGWPDKGRYLLSFAYLRQDQVDLCREYGVELIMDSGAFTTATKGKQMDHDGYLEWLAANSDVVHWALSYDVIGDATQSRINHEYGEDRVGDMVHLVPTYHLGSPRDELVRLCKQYDFICIGGAVSFAKQRDHLSTVLTDIHRVGAEHGTQFHGLGMTGNRIIHWFPWRSVDSSSWLSPARFPALPLADENGWLRIVEHGWKLERWEQDLIRAYGLNPDIMQTPGWSLKAEVGQELALARRIDILTATARAFMYVEAYKTAMAPESPLSLYLSGDQGIPGGSVGLIHRAHQLGNPYTHRLEPGEIPDDPHLDPDQSAIDDFLTEQDPTS